ncbi:MAG: SAM-dependent methyltransferase [Hyphomicrobiaceae bacterium]
MTTSPLVSKTGATTSMRGGGYYSQRTRGAKDVIDKASGMLMEAVAALPAPADGQPVRIADFGAADGGTSKKAMHDTVAAIRARFPEKQIVVTYTDLPSNDYSVLFKNMLGLTEEPELSYLIKTPGVFVHACGVGFHRQLMPDASLDLGFSATAMHYISEKPCEITTHVHMVGAKGAEREAFAKRAEADWINILLARAQELRPGGRLVFLNFGIDEEGRYLGHTGEANMFDTYDRLWKGLRDEGRITSEEYVRATFAQFYRTKEEFSAPLLLGGPAYAAGLRLISARTGVVKCPYRRAFDEANGAMSPRAFAESYVPTLRSWSETVFANALDPARPIEERAEIVDLFYRRYEDTVTAEPNRHAMDYVHCYLAIEKAGMG